MSFGMKTMLLTLFCRVTLVSPRTNRNTSAPAFLSQVELTPMAIAAGRRLADRLFGGVKDAKADYSNVPVRLLVAPTGLYDAAHRRAVALASVDISCFSY